MLVVIIIVTRRWYRVLFDVDKNYKRDATGREHEPLPRILEDLFVVLGKANLKDNAREEAFAAVLKPDESIWLFCKRGSLPAELLGGLAVGEGNLSTVADVELLLFGIGDDIVVAKVHHSLSEKIF